MPIIKTLSESKLQSLRGFSKLFCQLANDTAQATSSLIDLNWNINGEGIAKTGKDLDFIVEEIIRGVPKYRPRDEKKKRSANGTSSYVPQLC